MLLHSHPVNEARQARGEPAVNSLWLWGGGRMPGEARGPWRSVAAADPSALGLARVAGMQRLELPGSANAWLERLPENGRHLAVLDALRAAAALEQQAEHEEGVEALERRWFAPLLAALRAGRIGMVTVQVPDAGRVLRDRTRRPAALLAPAARHRALRMKIVERSWSARDRDALVAGGIHPRARARLCRTFDQASERSSITTRPFSITPRC